MIASPGCPAAGGIQSPGTPPSVSVSNVTPRTGDTFSMDLFLAFSAGVTLEDIHYFCQARPAQFPTFLHLLRVIPRAAKFRGSGIATGCLEPAHFARVCRKFPNQLLQPRVTNAECPGPSTTGWPAAVAASQPLEHESPDHLVLPDCCAKVAADAISHALLPGFASKIHTRACVRPLPKLFAELPGRSMHV